VESKDNIKEYPAGVIQPTEIAPGIFFSDKPHWAMNSFAGMGYDRVADDTSGCICRGYSDLIGLNLCLAPMVAIYRHYWSHKGRISCFLSYPNAMGAEDRFFWEIYCIEGALFDDIERYYTQAELDYRILSLLA
jgi:hypothetical protein